MQSKTLLMDISHRYADRTFRSTELANRLKVSRKIASNRLRRLHQMGFLKRRRQKRFCLWSRRKLISVKYRYGMPYRVRARVPRIRPCYKGFEYVYSLSRQGKSYVGWLRNRKPLEDIAYFTLLKEVMTALPEDLRYTLGGLGAVRGGYKYHGPTRQLRFLDNPATPLLVLVLQNQALQTENERLKRELFKAEVKAWCSEERACSARACSPEA
mgnify:CR=1 FL=1